MSNPVRSTRSAPTASPLHDLEGLIAHRRLVTRLGVSLLGLAAVLSVCVSYLIHHASSHERWTPGTTLLALCSATAFAAGFIACVVLLSATLRTRNAAILWLMSGVLGWTSSLALGLVSGIGSLGNRGSGAHGVLGVDAAAYEMSTLCGIALLAGCTLIGARGGRARSARLAIATSAAPWILALVVSHWPSSVEHGRQLGLTRSLSAALALVVVAAALLGTSTRRDALLPRMPLGAITRGIDQVLFWTLSGVAISCAFLVVTPNVLHPLWFAAQLINALSLGLFAGGLLARLAAERREQQHALDLRRPTPIVLDRARAQRVRTAATTSSATSSTSESLSPVIDLMTRQRTVDPMEPAIRALIDGAARATTTAHPIGIALQPICHIATGSMIGYEALARIGSVNESPEPWFIEAHRLGIGVELELAAARRALKVYAPGERWINVSPDTMTDRRLHDLVTSVDPTRVVIELTEQQPVHDYEALLRSVARLQRFGVRLAIDDADAGAITLRHIQHLGPDIVKLDRSLVDHVDQDPTRAELAAAVISLAHQVHAAVVAEGIERRAELDALRDLGASFGQGYLFGRPALVAEPLMSHARDRRVRRGHRSIV